MNEFKQTLKIKIYNEKNEYLEIDSEKMEKIEEIKKKCQEKFKYKDKDINNINLWFIDDDNDKNLINNNNDLMTYAKEIEASKFFIKLNVDINDKLKEDYINKIEEIEDKEIQNKNNNYLEINLNKKNEKIKQLKKQIMILNYKINYYKEKINKIILYYEKSLNDINFKLYNQIRDNKIIKNDEYLKKELKYNIENSDNTPQNKNIIKNNKLKINGKYCIKNIEFINNRCKKCYEKCLESIYKCVLCDNLFLCKNCHKNNIKGKMHEHNDFFEINYPKEVIKQFKEDINENIKINNIINSFYELLKSIFFDKNGNISLKAFNDSDIKNLKQICKDMKSFNEDPQIHFSKYHKIFINDKFQQLNSEIDKRKFADKLALFFNLMKF